MPRNRDSIAFSSADTCVPKAVNLSSKRVLFSVNLRSDQFSRSPSLDQSALWPDCHSSLDSNLDSALSICARASLSVCSRCSRFSLELMAVSRIKACSRSCALNRTSTSAFRASSSTRSAAKSPAAINERYPLRKSEEVKQVPAYRTAPLPPGAGHAGRAARSTSSPELTHDPYRETAPLHRATCRSPGHPTASDIGRP